MQMEKPVSIFALRADSWLSAVLPSFHWRLARWLMMIAAMPVGKKKNIVAMMARGSQVLGGCVVSSVLSRGGTSISEGIRERKRIGIFSLTGGAGGVGVDSSTGVGAG